MQCWISTSTSLTDLLYLLHSVETEVMGDNFTEYPLVRFKSQLLAAKKLSDTWAHKYFQEFQGLDILFCFFDFSFFPAMGTTLALDEHLSVC